MIAIIPDDSGAPAYDPKILLKTILFAYSRGITSSRKIERACRENVVFMAMFMIESTSARVTSSVTMPPAQIQIDEEANNRQP
ncbi:hypothetical protein DGMP_27410 [Desulfomarina profundi]|uniref:Transposase InsH N-terminal domain-containing protein n=1 Tax=Desulfomarina profundi TaxID=2772557 RepID=A0A8D5FMY1_9BACT|nr:transposase [Desulfomarina profundi]BCL62048.1 hypothetical protein DGMP_27410 [Desulfomarina profundi]